MLTNDSDGFTVRELVEALSRFDPAARVLFGAQNETEAINLSSVRAARVRRKDGDHPRYFLCKTDGVPAVVIEA